MTAGLSPPQADFRHVETWVFDLDNTLYPAECNLFSQIDRKMTQFVAQLLKVDAHEARRVQKAYYAEYGTTLNGLMTVHGLQPKAFLDFVHDIDLAPLDQAPDLTSAIEALPGRRFIFTNGSRRHAERVAERLRIDHLFHDVFDIEASEYTPKPARAAYERFITRTGLEPRSAVMFEDLSRNLEPAARLGFTTVLVRSQMDWSGEPQAARPAGPDEHPLHVHHATDNLETFLRGIVLPSP
jgi:putative hydrolase of the HAD superfamily